MGEVAGQVEITGKEKCPGKTTSRAIRSLAASIRAFFLLEMKFQREIDFEKIGKIENLSGLAYVEHRGKDHPCIANNDPFLALARGDAIAFD